MYPAPTHEHIKELDMKIIRLQKSTRATIPAMVRVHDLMRQKFCWYYNWHLNSKANFTHWAALTGCTVTAFVLLLTIVIKGPVSPVMGASNQAWFSSSDWNAWQLDNLTVTDSGLKLIPKAVQGISTKKIAQAVEEIPAVTPNEPVVVPEVTPQDQVKPEPVVTPEVTPQDQVTPEASVMPNVTLTPSNSIELTPSPRPTITPPVIPVVNKGVATLTFDPQDGEIVDWLRVEQKSTLNGGNLKIEFSTDNILWTEDIKALANSGKVYLRLTLESSNTGVSPVLENLGLYYSRLPLIPTDLQVSANVGILGLDQTISAGVFSDPDTDTHLASQWQITDKAGDYTVPVVDSDVDTKNLTSYKIKQELPDGAYYFRVRYQDSTEAWSPWSEDCTFKVNQAEVSVLGSEQVKANPNEMIDKRTETTKTIDNKNGTNTLEAYTGVVHYKDDYSNDKGKWKDINPNHYIDGPDYVLYDQLPSTVKVYKNIIGYEIQNRQSGEKYTIELQSVDGDPQLSTAKGVNNLVSWADINGAEAKAKDSKAKMLGMFLPKAFAQKMANSQDNGNLKFEFDITEYGVRLWKTIEGPDAPRNFKWKVTKSGEGDKLAFREQPDAYDVNSNGQVDLTKKVEVEAKKIEGNMDSTFIWQETAPKDNMKIDTDVTFYPAADGYVEDNGEKTWANKKSAAGTAASLSDTSSCYVEITSGGASPNWLLNRRSIFTFDTSSLGSSATISAATASFYGTYKADGLSLSPTLNIYAATPASNTSLAASDYAQTGSTAFATAITYAAFDQYGYNNFALNASGIANISKTSYSRFALKEGVYDAGSSSPAWNAGYTQSYMNGYYSEQSGTTQDPKLAVTYSVVSNYTITSSTDANGTISPLGATTVASGDNQAFTFSGNSGYHISTLLIDGAAQSTLTSPYTFTNVTANHTIAITTVADNTCVWTGLGADNNWSTTLNWSGNAVPVSTCDVIFNATSTKASTIDASFASSIKSLALNTGYANTLSASTGLTILNDVTLVAGTLAPGSQTINVAGSWTNTGSNFTYATSTVNFNGSTAGKTVSANSKNFYTLIFAYDRTLSADIVAINSLTVSAGTFTSGANNVTLRDLILTGGTFTAPTSTKSLSVLGNFTHTAGVYTAPANSTVTLIGPGASTQVFSGDTTFVNLTATATAAKTVQFAGSSTQTITGTWTVTGAASQLITLERKTGDSGVWNINPTGWVISYASVSNSTNQAATKINPTNSADAGGNTNWFLSTPVAPSGVNINTISASGFTVGWTDNSSNETLFKVYVANGTADCSTATFSGVPYSINGIDDTDEPVIGRSINTQYCAKVVATNADGDSSAAYASPKYTLANVPTAPTLGSPTLSSIPVTINQNSNPASTTYSVKVVEGANTNYLATNGTLSASPVWDTYANFGGASGVTSTGLASNTNYTYSVAARNGDTTNTAYGTSANATTSVTYTITASTDAHGTISPLGVTTVASGDTRAITFSASSGYYVSTLTVDGVGQSDLTSPYTFTNITANHTISLVTVADNSCVWTGLGADNNWSTTLNWSGSTVPVATCDVVFNGTSTKASTIDVGFTNHIKSLSINSGYTNTVSASTTLNNDGAMTLVAGTFAPGSQTINVAGNWTNSGGTFTKGTSTINFNSTATGKTLSGTMSGSSAFYNLTFDGVGGGWTLGSPVTVSNNLAITNGTVDDSGNQITGNATGTMTTGAGGTLKLSGGTSQTATVVQHKSLYNGGTLSIAPDAAPSAGNLLIAVIDYADAASNLSPTVSDSNGNTWSTVSKFIGTGQTNPSIAVAWAYDCKAGATTITWADIHRTNNDVGTQIIEVSGIVNTSDPFDSRSNMDGKPFEATTTPTLSNFTTNYKSFILAIYSNELQTSTFTQGANYTILDSNPTHVDAEEYRAAAPASSTNSASFTTSTGVVDWIISALNFKEAGSATTTFPTGFTTAHTTLNAASTIVYNSLTDQTISSTPVYGNLQLSASSGSPTKTLDGNTTINGNLTVDASNTLDASNSGNYSVDLAGNFASSGSFYSRAGTVTLSGTGTIVTNAQSFYNLTINSSGSYSLSSAMTATNNLTVSAGTLTSGTNTITTKDFTQSGGTFTVPTSDSILNISGNFTHSSGTFTAPTPSMVALNGAGGSTQVVSGDTTFNILDMSTTSARTIQFAGGSTQTINSLWSVIGSPVQLLTLERKTGDSGVWNINPASWNVTYVSVSNSTNLASAKINPTASIDGGGNTMWFLSMPSAPTGVSINTITSSGFTVGWTDNSSNETGFKVYTATGNVDCSAATYSGTPDYTTAADAVTQAITSKSANTWYCAKVVATNADGDSTAAYGSPKYTLANVPTAPTLGSSTSSTIPLTINQNSNPANTAYSIKVVEGANTNYLAINGTLSTTPVWDTYANFGGGSGVSSLGLDISTNYTYSVAARNGDSTDTAYGASANATTLATYTVTASTDAHGTISPLGVTTVDYGSNQAVTFSPASGYYISALIIDGAAQSDLTSPYTFTNITAGHTISITTVADNICIWTGSGADDNWSTTLNWSGNSVPVDTCDVIFNSTSTKASIIDTDFTNSIKSLSLNSGYTNTLSASADLIILNNMTLAAGTFAPGSQTINVGGSWTNTGTTFTKGTSTINFNGSTAGKTISTNAQSFYNLTISYNRSLSSAAMATNNLTVSAGTLISGANNITTKDLTVSGGTLTAPTSANSLNVSGNFAHNSGIFTAPASSTVNLTGSSGSTQVVTGDTTFVNLTATAMAARTIQFAGSSTQTVTGIWTVTGASNQLITLERKIGDSGVWNINPTGWAVSYTSVSNSTNQAAAKINPSNSTDSGGNTMWFLDLPIAPTGVNINTISTTGFTVGWTDNSSNETSFKVYTAAGNADCSAATYSGTPDYTTAADAVTQAITSKSANTWYCAKVVASNADGGSSVAYAAPKYTLANVPTAPILGSPTSSSIPVTINQNSNPASTTYSVKVVEGVNTNYLATNGTLSTTSVWDTYANFGGASGVTSTGLTSNTNYTYSVAARNGDSTDTAYGTSANATTLVVYTITASTDVHGTISPLGVTTVSSGATQALTFSADTGYYLAEIKIDGTSLNGALSSPYTFTNITANHTIAVSFALNNTCVWDGGAIDANWSSANNWTGNVVPDVTCDVIFNSTSTKASTIDNGFSSNLKSLLVNTGYTNTITSNIDLTINEDMSLAAGTLSPETHTINLAGDLIVSGGTFNPGTSTVILTGNNQALSGNNSFYNLTKSVASDVALTFASGSIQTVTGLATLKSDNTHLLSLVSSTPGVQWQIDLQGTKDLDYLEIQDAKNIGTQIIVAHTSDLGNNTNWYLTDSYTLTSTSPQIAGACWSQTVQAKDAYTDNSTSDSATTISMTDSSLTTKFYTSNACTSETSTYVLASGLATIYVKDLNINTELITLTAIDVYAKTVTSANINVENTAPTEVITAPENNVTVGAGTVQIAGTAEDTLGGTVAKVEVSTDGGSTWTQATGTTDWNYDFASSASGTYTVRARATDSLGLVGAVSDLVTFNIDTEIPTVKITDPLPDVWISTVYTIKGTAADLGLSPISKVEISTNGTSWVTATGTTNWTYDWEPTDGTYTIQARATDGVLNVSQVYEVSVKVDRTVPSVPSALKAFDVSNRLGNSLQTYLSWKDSTDTGSGLKEYEIYRNNEKIGVSLESSYVDTKLANSTYTYQVKAMDNSGNISESGKVDVDLASGETGKLVISEISASPSKVVTLSGTTSAIISWKTDRPSTSMVQYGLSGVKGKQTDPQSRFNTGHTMILTDLQADTTYHFIVASSDVYGNKNESTDQTFKTLPAPIEESIWQKILKALQNAFDWLGEVVAAPMLDKLGLVKTPEQVTASAIVFDVTNSEAAKTEAFITVANTQSFGLERSIGSGSFNTLGEGSNGYYIDKNLNAKEKYTYKIKGVDGIISLTPGGGVSGPPQISDVVTKEISIGKNSSQVLISWQTDQLTTGEIDINGEKIKDENLGQSHVVLASDLNHSTSYRIKIKALTDKNETLSREYTLMTSVVPIDESVWEKILKTMQDTFGFLLDWLRT